MINDYFKNLIYQRINFEQIYRKVQNQRRGVLYSIVYWMITSLEIEESQSKAEEICTYFNIQQSSHIKEDFSQAYDKIGEFYINSIRKEFWNFAESNIPKNEKNLFITFCSNLEDKKQMEIIVVTAFILISGFALVKWNSSNQSQQQKELPKPRETPIISPKQPIPTSICLVVPASEVFGLTLGQSINKDKIIQLIDASSDFLCIAQKEAENLVIGIDMNQTALPDSKLDFYIRIDISDGQNIIGKETKYVIKRDLLPNIRGEIKKLGLLESISSVSSFNRI